MSHDPPLLLDMLLAARRVIAFAAKTSSTEFLTDEFAQSAIHYQIQVIGEAAYKVSKVFRDQHPEIAWEPICGLRHRLVHDYGGIEPAVIWKIVEQHVPELIRLLEPLAPPLEPGGTTDDSDS